MKLEKLSAANMHERAARNRLAALAAIGYFGHLRKPEIAMAVWPSSPADSSARMSTELVKALLDSRLIAESVNAFGTRSYRLTRKGVGHLRSYGIEVGEAVELSSIAGPQFYHRTLGTLYLLDKGREPSQPEVLGEYALLRGYGSISRAYLSGRFHKFPDGLVLRDAELRDYSFSGKVVDWVEVESAYKSQEGLDSILNIAWQTGSWIDARETLLLDRVVFVINSAQAHERYITAALRRHIKNKPLEIVQHFLSSVIIARADLALPLRWKGCTEVSAYELLGGLTEAADASESYGFSGQDDTGAAGRSPQEPQEKGD